MHCPCIPDEMLQPVSAWQDADAYQEKVRELAKLYKENFRYLAVTNPHSCINVYSNRPRLNQRLPGLLLKGFSLIV